MRQGWSKAHSTDGMSGSSPAWAAGCQNGTELWRRLRDAGFNSSLRVVSEWRTCKRRSVGSCWSGAYDADQPSSLSSRRLGIVAAQRMIGLAKLIGVMKDDADSRIPPLARRAL